MRPGANGTVTSCPAFFAACSTAAHPPRTIRSASETFVPAGLRAVEVLLDLLEGLQHLGQFGRVVDLPVPLRREANPRPVGPATLVGAAEACRRRPRGGDQLGDGQSRCEDLALEGSDVLAPRSVHDRPRGRGPATAAAPEPTGRGSARRVPCRGATACTTPWRTRLRAGPDSRGSASRSARRSDPSSAQGPSSASWGRAASTDHERPARCPGPRDSWESTGSHRRGSSSAPSRT